MKIWIVQQPITLTVTNNDLQHSETYKRHNELLRSTIRCLLA
jgi:hypothetical protein